MLSRTLLCLAVCGASSAALADTVWLKNGDRLTGDITVFDGGKLMLQTSYGGSVPIDMKQVKTLESSHELLVKQGKYDEQKAKTIKAADDGKITLENGENKTVDIASVQQIIRPKPVITDLVWKGNIDAALDFKRADTDTDDYNIAFKTTARSGRWRHTATGEYNRETQQEVTTTDNFTLDYAVDRFITDKWFWDGRLNYNRDHIEDLQRQRIVGTGPGYQFWDDELGAFSLIGLVNRTDYEYRDGSLDNFMSASVRWDYNRFLIGKTVEFFTEGELGKPLSGAANYSLTSDVGLRYKVTEWASLNLKMEKDQVSGSDNGDLNTTRYTAGLGLTW
ncbi:DUF481 domain-containing protein [Pseudomonas sp. HR96]|uniref:DUF481 domain-containing protein n=1 Tax=Pseudomonas sp. HR96 TaxID=1027966 RepID=UPI002A7535E6|nr:DUF481 domain-containing protein [Pseudomonas sp. HR96]WPO99161.1 DUF481 domain-containing protein [Pseudomonas sp. HR96]